MKGLLRMAARVVSLHLPLHPRPRPACRSIGRHAKDQLLLLVLLGAAAHNLDLVRIDQLAAVVELERDIADQEGPDFVAKAVGIERTLSARPKSVLFASLICTKPIQTQPSAEAPVLHQNIRPEEW